MPAIFSQLIILVIETKIMILISALQNFYVLFHRFDTVVALMKLNLDPLSLSVVQKMDGQKAIDDILIETSINDTLDIKLDGYSVEYVGELFQALWQSDFIEIKLDSC